MDPPPQRAKRAFGRKRYFPRHACQRRFRRSTGLRFGRRRRLPATGSGAGVHCGAGAARRFARLLRGEAHAVTRCSAYSRRIRCPSFFSMQTEKPGIWRAVLEASSTSLSRTGE